MATIETSLHASYQANTWGISEALREIISNALDGEERYRSQGLGKMSLKYSARRRELVVRSYGVTVPARALLMGTSEARAEERAIGQFGEGLPMALLVLARQENPVQIDNGEERWVPSIERSSAYDGEPVLVVRTRRLRVPRDWFEVRVGLVSPEVWDKTRRLFLRLHSDFDERQAFSDPVSGAQVLTQPEFRGKLFNKGVLVTSREDLLFGYDLRGDVNRDRSILDETDLRVKLQLLLGRVSGSTPEFHQIFADRLLETVEALEASTMSALLGDDTFGEKLLEAFRERYGEDAYGVPSYFAGDLKEVGLNEVLVSHAVADLLAEQEEHGHVGVLRRRERKRVVLTHNHSALTSTEVTNLRIAEVLCRSLWPSMRGVDFQVVTFAGEDVGCDADKTDNTLKVSRDVLDCLESVLEEVAEAASYWSGRPAGRNLARLAAHAFSGDEEVQLLRLGLSWQHAEGENQ